ncbi:uncharacterized protein LOC127987234 [Carassius gibelio]|uniref:uncharacterized protein LOC127987234 n=1 Tax=Carassius gibelio TaxID=101364 RepID=UPI002279D030|nr:uncharacterized protein LOC127987234 [Carassius gibelio]
MQVFSSAEILQQMLVCVSDGPSARRGEMKTKSVVEGEYVTLDPGEINHPNVVMTWYFNETLIAEITGDQSEICSDVQCKERFRDRLKLDHQTGSLIITDTRTTDSGEYKLEISSSSSGVVVTSLKSFSVSITVAGLSAGGKAGMCVFAVLLIITASVCGFYFYKRRVNKKDIGTQHNDQSKDVHGGQSGTPLINVTHERSSNHTNAPEENTASD